MKDVMVYFVAKVWKACTKFIRCAKMASGSGRVELIPYECLHVFYCRCNQHTRPYINFLRRRKRRWRSGDIGNVRRDFFSDVERSHPRDPERPGMSRQRTSMSATMATPEVRRIPIRFQERISRFESPSILVTRTKQDSAIKIPDRASLRLGDVVRSRLTECR